MNNIEKVLASNRNVFTAFVRKRLGDEHLAEDVVQESLLKALKSSRAPASDDELVVWFYRILRRSIIDIYRRKDSRTRMLERFREALPDMPKPDERRVLCQCFRHLLPGMPEASRTLLERIDLGEQSPASVAADLKISVNALHVRLHRARKQLRGELEKTCRICSKHGCLDCTCDAPAPHP